MCVCVCLWKVVQTMKRLPSARRQQKAGGGGGGRKQKQKKNRLTRFRCPTATDTAEYSGIEVGYGALNNSI